MTASGSCEADDTAQAWERGIVNKLSKPTGCSIRDLDSGHWQVRQAVPMLLRLHQSRSYRMRRVTDTPSRSFPKTEHGELRWILKRN